MPIAAIPKATRKIYERPSKVPIKAWNRQIKLVKDTKLVKTLKTLINSDEQYDSSVWKFAGVVLSELYVRKWRKKHTKELEGIKQSLVDKSKLCFSSRGYALETAGIIDEVIKSKTNRLKVIHPYSFSKTAQKVIIQWEWSKTTKSLNEYIRKKISQSLADYIRTHTITYLSDAKRNKYRVTFEGDSIKISNKTPKDGWYIYVLDADSNELFAGRKKTGKFHHTSFLAGAPVASAGEFEIINGKIELALLRSGHYRPTEEHGQALRAFLGRPDQLGPERAAALEIEPYDNG